MKNNKRISLTDKIKFFFNALIILPFLICFSSKLFWQISKEHKEIKEFYKQIIKDILMGLPIVFLLIWLVLK
jgi:histidinol phosphatase-like PHP family hydrolase